MSETREPRGMSREITQLESSKWTPPNLLPDPIPNQGWAFRWIRTSMVGQSDATNVSMRFREGWEPVKLEDHPELEVMPDHNSQFPGCVEIGGQLLCRLRRKLRIRASVITKGVAAQQMEEVLTNLTCEKMITDAMLRPDRKTRVSSFGK